jgi:hypothetical protein
MIAEYLEYNSGIICSNVCSYCYFMTAALRVK